MVVISVVSAKGGVGKTTLSACLAMGLAASRDVLAVDLDPQNALKLHLGVHLTAIIKFRMFRHLESTFCTKSSLTAIPAYRSLRLS